MVNAPPEDYPDLREDQMLAIGIYGETVAAYRYTVLAEKLPDERDRRTFAAIADEEQQHRTRLQKLQQQHYPDRSFYLSEQDKALVVAGPRLVDVRDIDDYREVMRLALDTEWRVAQFYRTMAGRMANPKIRSVFGRLAEEGFGHHRRLTELASVGGLLPEEPQPQ